MAARCCEEIVKIVCPFPCTDECRDDRLFTLKTESICAPEQIPTLVYRGISGNEQEEK